MEAQDPAPREEPTYILDVALHAAGGALASSSSDLTLRLHDPATLRTLRELGGHADRACGLVFSHARPDLLYSASEDGAVRAWDVRRPGGSAAQVFRGPPSHGLCSFDLSCGDVLLCAGTPLLEEEDSLLVFWDSRKANAAPLGVYSDSHSDDVTQVRFHPGDKDRLASGSTDCLVNIFDLRRASEEEALLCTCNGDAPVTSVCWAGPDASRLLCLSHNRGLRLWDLRRLETEQPLSVLGCADARRLGLAPGGRGLGFLVGGAWLEEAGRLLLLGGDAAGQVQLMECDGDGLRLLAGLRGGHAAPVRCFAWDEARGALLTGGEDGRLLLWKPEGRKGDGPSAALKRKWGLRQTVRIRK